MQDIKGLRYIRLPFPGETITCKTRAGDMIAVEIWAGREVIAWDQIQEPVGQNAPKKFDSAVAKRERLCRIHADHWRAEGFEVTQL